MVDGAYEVASHTKGVVNDKRNTIIMGDLELTQEGMETPLGRLRTLDKAGKSEMMYLGLPMLSV